MKKVISVMVAVLLMVSILPAIVGAEELQPGKCEMTIISNKHNWDNMAQASGPCEGRIEGYYLAETNTFQLVGAVTMAVTQNGQEFKMGTPQHPYGHSILTVYIQKVEDPKPAQPKEEPKPKPTQPKEEPKPEPKPTQPKKEPKQETKPKQETSINTSPKQETSTTTIKPKQEASNSTKPESKPSSVTQENKTEIAQKVDKQSETNEEKEEKSKMSSTEEQEAESEESDEEEDGEEESTEDEEENELASSDIEEVASSSIESKPDSKSAILPGVIISIILLVGAGTGGFIWYRRRKRA